MFTVITKYNKVSKVNPLDIGVVLDDTIIIDELGGIALKKGNPITWPADASDGIQAIVDVNKATIRFGVTNGIMQKYEYVVSTYGDSGTVPKPKLKEFTSIEDAPPAPHIFDVINYWPEAGAPHPGTKGLPEGWMWQWMGDDWVLSNGTIGLVRDDWFKYSDKMVELQRLISLTAEPSVRMPSGLTREQRREWAKKSPMTKEEVMALIDTWPIHLERNGQEITEDWVWIGINGITVIVNQSTGKTITESDWREYLVGILRDNPPVEIGTKADSGKPMMGCIPPHAELAVARVLTFGAQKYSRGNWAHVENSDERYMDAAMRHINAHRRGENTDSETGENHLAHAICCLMFMLDGSETN